MTPPPVGGRRPAPLGPDCHRQSPTGGGVSGPSKRAALWPTLLFLGIPLAGILAGLVWWALHPAQMSPARVERWLLSAKQFAPLLYLVVYAQPVVPVPASVMTIASGLTFGSFWGLWAAAFGATARACNQFVLARWLGRTRLERVLKGRLARLDEQIGRHGLHAVLFIRLVPNLPFDMQNYCLGCSRIRFPAYAIGTFLGILPGTFAFVYLGDAFTHRGHAWKAVVAVVILVGLIVLQRRWMARKTRREGACQNE